MGDQGRWFKLWTTAPADPHLGNLSLEDFARWCLFGIYMKVHGTDGTVTLTPPVTALQQLFRVSTPEDVFNIIRKFPNCNGTPVTTPTVTVDVEWKNWLKYQGDYSGDRVARWRKKTRHAVTPKTRRDEKRREENITPPTPTPSADWKLNSALYDAVKQTRFTAFLGDEGWWTAQFRAFEIRFAEEVPKAEAWCRSNPGRAPKRDLKRFLHTWFSRAQERTNG